MTVDRRSVVMGAAAGGMALGASACATTERRPAATTPAEPPPRHAEANSVTGEAPTPRLRHAFSVSIFFQERIMIASMRGRAFVPTQGGEVWGPRLQGRVVPYSGADYSSGGLLDAHYVLEANDGALIYIHNIGYMKGIGAEPRRTPAPEPLAPGEALDQNMQGTAFADVPLRMRLTPTFDAPEDGPHAWMNSTLFVGHGGRFVNPDHTIFTYYEVL